MLQDVGLNVLHVAVHASLKSIHEVLTLERERLKQAWAGPDLRQNTSQQFATLCTTMSEVTHTHMTDLTLSCTGLAAFKEGE